MRTATIRIRRGDAQALQEAGAAFIHAWNGGGPVDDVYTFASPAQLFTVITPRRWDLIERLQALGPVSLRALARALGRDVKGVHEDVAILREWGLIERNAAGKFCVPYERIHADFDLHAAA